MVQQAETRSSFCRLVREGIDKCRVALPPPPGANRSLVDEPAFSPAELHILRNDFERRLESIVSFARCVGAVPILILPPGNDSGFDPNRSYLPSKTTRAEREAFAARFLAARKLEESDPAGSLTRYQALIDEQPGFAELHYRLARLHERSGHWDQAYHEDVAARDLDGLPDAARRHFRKPTARWPGGITAR